MGNGTSSEQFNPEGYQRNSGLSTNEVLGIRNVFEGLDPKDGVIQTSTLRRLYRDSFDAPQLNQQIGNKESLTFDEFFQIMRIDMLHKKEKFGNVDFDDGINENVQCFFCQPHRQQ